MRDGRRPPSLALALTLPAALAMATGCQLERLFPEDVGAGVARLTVRNAAVLLSAVSDDDTCGFASTASKQSAVIEGELGGLGKVTHRVVDCEIDAGELHQLKTDCTDVGTMIGGRVVVNATRVINGIVTGNPEKPVIPVTSEDVWVDIDADMDGWTTRLTNRETQLTNLTGRLAYRVVPHLANSASASLSSIPTSNLTIQDITYSDATVIVDSGDRDPFPVEVPRSSYMAQVGLWGEDENTFRGVVSVWDQDVSVPVKGDSVLDPDYDAEEFVSSYICTPDLAQPISYEPVPLRPKLVQAAARLTVKLSGGIVTALNADDTCGFLAPSVKQNPVIVGDVGKNGGSVTYTVAGCSLVFPEQTEIARDCLGAQTFLQGGANVSATMTVRGILTGDPDEPVVPSSREPAEIKFTATMAGLKVSGSNGDTDLQFLSGTLSAVMRPRMAKDELSGACSISTPVVSFSGVHVEQGTALLGASGNTFRLVFDRADYEAQNGNRDGVENALTGEAQVDGERIGIPIPTDFPILNPAYDATSFDAAYACTPHMVPVTSDDECRFTDVLGGGAARLIIQTAGTLTSLINSNDSCGYADMLGVLVSPSVVVGDVGESGSMSWEIEGCEVGTTSLAVASESCIGDITYFRGGAVVDSSRTVTGEREKKFFLVDSIIPRSRDAVTVWLDAVQLTDFVVYMDPAGPDEPIGKLTIHTGTLSGVVQPATGERADDPGIFDVPTPVAKLTDVKLVNATATLETQGKVFHLTIASADLAAVNGPYQGQTNMIGGSITVNDDVIQLAPAPLNPTYAQAGFDAAYACTENLAGPVPVQW